MGAGNRAAAAAVDAARDHHAPDRLTYRALRPVSISGVTDERMRLENGSDARYLAWGGPSCRQVTSACPGRSEKNNQRYTSAEA